MFIQLISSITCVSYPYIAAFGIDNTSDSTLTTLLMIEGIFLIDIIISFFVSYKNEGELYSERDSYKIA